VHNFTLIPVLIKLLKCFLNLHGTPNLNMFSEKCHLLQIIPSPKPATLECLKSSNSFKYTFFELARLLIPSIRSGMTLTIRFKHSLIHFENVLPPGLEFLTILFNLVLDITHTIYFMLWRLSKHSKKQLKS
jgi:hypothetical protein